MPSFAVSIVICTLDRAHTLEEAIRAAHTQAYDNFEVIVVPGPSSDSTGEILARWTGRVKVVPCADANLAVARNVGIEAARGEIIAFIDDDCAPHPLWLQRLTSAYSNPALGGAGGFTLDGTGRRFQVCKTLCDRFGAAHEVSPFFDERAVCFAQSPLFPSLLGTNCSFRRKALDEVGGFDHAFAYFLDETDLCLRLIDAGWQIEYVPEALVQHRFAASALRDSRSIPRTLYSSARSKAYFIWKHGLALGLERASAALSTYRAHLLHCNAGLRDAGAISEEHRSSLDQDVAYGVRDGIALASEKNGQKVGDLASVHGGGDQRFLGVRRDSGTLRVALVSQGFPPEDEGGIATWTKTLAEGLSRRGHAVHVITRGDEDRGVSFEAGVWVHRVRPNSVEGMSLSRSLDLPLSICSWAVAVKAELGKLKRCGLDVVSHPIWDAEGAAIWNDRDFKTVLSLHTTYQLARRFKPEWQARPLYEHFFVNKVINEERRQLAGATTILANSDTIIRDIEKEYDLEIRSRAIIIPHGTRDLGGRSDVLSHRSFQVSYIGRFELRKGFDIALRSLARFLNQYPAARVIFAGGELNEDATDLLEQTSTSWLLSDTRVQFAGLLSRSELDKLQRDSDVVVLPSRYESFGLVAIEAMSAGAAVVALRCPGLEGIVEDKRSGFLVEFSESVDLEFASRLVELAQDRKLRQRMGDRGRELFEKHYTIEKMAIAVEQAYSVALSDSGGGTSREN